MTHHVHDHDADHASGATTAYVGWATTRRTGRSAPTSRTRSPASTRRLADGVDGPTLAAYCLMLGDDALVYSHRLSEWCSRAPDLEEDIALANIALDLLGQARLLLARAAAADPAVVPALPEGSPVPARGRAGVLPRGRRVPQRPARRARQRRLRDDDRAAAGLLDLAAGDHAAARRQRRHRAVGDRGQGASRRSPTTATTPAAGSSRWRRGPRSPGAASSPPSTRCGRSAASSTSSTRSSARAVGEGFGVDPAPSPTRSTSSSSRCSRSAASSGPSAPALAAVRGRTGRDGLHTEALSRLLAEMQVGRPRPPDGPVVTTTATPSTALRRCDVARDRDRPRDADADPGGPRGPARRRRRRRTAASSSRSRRPTRAAPRWRRCATTWCTGCSRRRVRRPRRGRAQPRVVERLDHRARPRGAAPTTACRRPGPRPAPRGPGAADAAADPARADLPAVRLGRRTPDLGVRRHRLQGALPLRRRASSRSSTSRRSDGDRPTFHPLRVAGGRGAHRRRGRGDLRRARLAGRGVRVRPRPEPDAAPHGRRRRGAPSVLHQRRRPAPGRGSACARSRTACSRGGWCARCGRATRSRCCRRAGSFCPDPAYLEGGRHLCIAAGSGITPMLSVAASVLANGGEVTLLYGNRTTGSVMFAEELADLKNRYGPQLQLVHVLSREPPRRRAVLRPARRRPAAPAARRCWCPVDRVRPRVALRSARHAARRRTRCSPSSACRRSGCTSSCSTSTSRRPSCTAPTPSSRARPARSPSSSTGARTTAPMPRGQSILDARRRTRTDLPFACKGGVCGTCRALVRDGEVDMRRNYALEEDEVERGLRADLPDPPRQRRRDRRLRRLTGATTRPPGERP